MNAQPDADREVLGTPDTPPICDDDAVQVYPPQATQSSDPYSPEVLRAITDHLIRRTSTVGMLGLTGYESMLEDARALNYQVENGGFGQWIYNGYVRRVRATRRALLEIGAADAENLLLEATAVWRQAERLREAEFVDEYRLRRIDEWERRKTDHLDCAYYALRPPVLERLVDWVRNTASENSGAFPGLRLPV